MKYIPQPRTQTCYEITIYCYLPCDFISVYKLLNVFSRSKQGTTKSVCFMSRTMNEPVKFAYMCCWNDMFTALVT